MKRFFSIWILTLVGVVQIFAQPFAFDFSYVGYQQSEKEIPDADVVVFVKWKEGDQSARIQKAIDFVSARKMDKKTGLRGAVLLDKGVFELSQPLRIQTSGVVLRGTDRNQTVLYKKERSIQQQSSLSVRNHTTGPAHIDFSRMPAPIAQILACTKVSTTQLLYPLLGRRTYYQYLIAHLAAGRQRHLPLSQFPG